MKSAVLVQVEKITIFELLKDKKKKPKPTDLYFFKRGWFWIWLFTLKVFIRLFSLGIFPLDVLTDWSELQWAKGWKCQGVRSREAASAVRAVRPSSSTGETRVGLCSRSRELIFTSRLESRSYQALTHFYVLVLMIYTSTTVLL